MNCRMIFFFLLESYNRLNEAGYAHHLGRIHLKHSFKVAIGNEHVIDPQFISTPRPLIMSHW
jgi:hypothetical protein